MTDACITHDTGELLDIMSLIDDCGRYRFQMKEMFEDERSQSLGKEVQKQIQIL